MPEIYTPVAIGLASTMLNEFAMSLFPELDLPEQAARLAPEAEGVGRRASNASPLIPWSMPSKSAGR
jgi:hypothetical protein